MHEMHSEDGFGPKMLADVKPPFIPEGASGMTVLVEWAPGDPGTPPHRHSGPCFGYVLEGAVRWELEGEPEHVIKAGETWNWRSGPICAPRGPPADLPPAHRPVPNGARSLRGRTR
jgi:hypothetical protein